MASSEFLKGPALPLNLRPIEEENEQKNEKNEDKSSNLNEEVTKNMENKNKDQDLSQEKEQEQTNESMENETPNENENLDIPKKTAETPMINIRAPEQTVRKLTPRITVVGVGGAGGNAVNNMIEDELKGVDFIVANADAQALAVAKTERTIQLGLDTTQGLGAGSRPEVGKAAAEETLDQIIEEIQGSNMVFITAGMGGGTGTGAAPVIARAAREQGILTVGVVTKPFQFEGIHRTDIAEDGIEELAQHVDTLIVIPNQNLFIVANEKTTLSDAFKMADDVLYSGVRSVTDLIVRQGLINLDFADIKTAMSNMGKAMMGTGEAQGEKRALEAAETAIRNPLLDNTSMKGARSVLINITGGMDLTLLEVDEATRRITDEVGAETDARIIFGACFDDDLEGKIRVSVVATGLDYEGMEQNQPQLSPYSFGQPNTNKTDTQSEYEVSTTKIETNQEETSKQQMPVSQDNSKAIASMPNAKEAFAELVEEEKQEEPKKIEPTMPGQLGSYNPNIANIPAKPAPISNEEPKEQASQQLEKQEDLFIPQAPAQPKEQIKTPSPSPVGEQQPNIKQNVSFSSDIEKPQNPLEKPTTVQEGQGQQKSSTIFEKVVGIGMMGRKHKQEEPEKQEPKVQQEPEKQEPKEENKDEKSQDIPEFMQGNLEKPAYIRNDIDIPDFLRRKSN